MPLDPLGGGGFCHGVRCKQRPTPGRGQDLAGQCCWDLSIGLVVKDENWDVAKVCKTRTHWNFNDTQGNHHISFNFRLSCNQDMSFARLQ